MGVVKSLGTLADGCQHLGASWWTLGISGVPPVH